MKRACLSIILVMIFFLSGCSLKGENSEVAQAANNPAIDGFEVVKSTKITGMEAISRQYIVADKETKVEYMIITTADNKISITPLYTEDGKPKIYKGK